MSTRFQVFQSSSNEAVCDVAGEVDVVNVGDFMRAIDQAIATECPAVVLNLERCSYLDSSTLHAIINASLGLQRESRRLTIVVPRSPSMRRVLDLVGMAKFCSLTEPPRKLVP